jgi:quercetin dioxygenase-like cupin family protein
MPHRTPEPDPAVVSVVHPNPAMKLSGWTAALTSMLLLGASSGATEPPSARNMSQMKFDPVPGLPTCFTASIQSGDPTQTAFVALATLKAGCEIPFHRHSANEQLMIVQGAPRVEMKDGMEPMTLTAGGFTNLPADHIHQLKCTRACTLFLVSDGKFDIHYVDAQGKDVSPEEALRPLNETAVAPPPATKP